MRVVVTGGRGFIGLHLAAALRARGDDVVAVDLRPGAVQADVASDPLEPLLSGADAVVHLAALPGVRTRHPAAELWRTNVLATARIGAALPPGCRIVLASTSSVYGDAAVLPTPEHAAIGPLNPYAASKAAAERACPLAVSVRLFTVFGPGQRPDMAFARWIDGLSAGRALPWCAAEGAQRDFTYVDDAVRGLVAALDRGRPGEAYNVAGGGPAGVRDALAVLEDLLGRRAQLAPGPSAAVEAVVTSACSRKSEAELGYRPRVGLREGLERQLAVSLSPARAA